MKQIVYSLHKNQTLRGIHKPAPRVNGKVPLLPVDTETVFAALRPKRVFAALRVTALRANGKDAVLLLLETKQTVFTALRVAALRREKYHRKLHE